MTFSKMFWSLVVASAVTTAACGDSKSSMNPVAPSAVVVDGSHSDESGGAISTATGKGNGGGNSNSGPGNNNGNGNGNDKGNGNNSGPGNSNGKDDGHGNQPSVPSPVQPPTNTTPTTTRKVEIEGMISAKAGALITVDSQDVNVPADAVIRHGDRTFTVADLHVGDRVHVKGTRTTTGSGATATSRIDASEVKLQNPGDAEDDGGDDDANPPASVLVSVTALDATASETGPDLGAFRFTRTGATTAALTVTIMITGTATNGTDYSSLPLTVTFAAGQATANVVVVPLADTVSEGSETVIVTVVDGVSYVAGSPATATVTIAG